MSVTQPIIMVVEDESLLLQAITKKLKLEGIETVSCGSGHQAFDYLENLPELPDAIWLDYYLKDMNGIEFMDKLKSIPKCGAIPVVVISNSASPDKVNHMMALGVKKYVIKAEHRLDELIKIMKNFIIGEHQSSSPTAPGTI